MNFLRFSLLSMFFVGMARADYVATVACNGTNQNGLVVSNCPIPLGSNETVSKIVGVTSYPVNNITQSVIPCVNQTPYFQNYDLNLADNAISVWGGCNGVFQVKITETPVSPVLDYKYGPKAKFKNGDSGNSDCPGGYRLVSCSWEGDCSNKDSFDTGCHAKAKEDKKCSVQSYCYAYIYPR